MILLNLSNLPWVDKRLKRNQAIFSGLLESGIFTHGVYVQPPEYRSPRTSRRLQMPFVSEVVRAPIGRTKAAILQPVFTLPYAFRPVEKASASILARAIRKALRPGEPYVLWMNSIEPLWMKIIARLAADACLRVFDSSDDFVALERAETARRIASDNLAAVLRLADRVLAVNEHVAAKLRHDHCIVFHNCTDFEAFQKPVPEALVPLPPKRAGERFIGFIGGLNEGRIDTVLLTRLLTHFQQHKFFFVGYSNSPSLRRLVSTRPNSAFVEEAPYDILPGVIRRFDVSIVPHLDNAHTRGNDLLKVLDCLACGVPVVTTRCSNVERYASACYIRNSHDEFIETVAALLDGRIRHDAQPGIEIARSRSWKTHVPRLPALLSLPAA